MTQVSGRVSVWQPPEALPQGCNCRNLRIDEITRMTCGGTADHKNGCPGMTGWFRPDGFWCQDLPPPPPSSPLLDPGLYDEHAHFAVELMMNGQARSKAEACRKARDKLGEGRYWGPNDPKTGVPDRLYKRVGALLRGR